MVFQTSIGILSSTSYSCLIPKEGPDEPLGYPKRICVIGHSRIGAVGYYGAALLWRSSQMNAPPRVPIQMSADQPAKVEPSWTWSGWHGSANWQLMMTWGGRLKSLIEGFALKDSENAQNH